jgi:hypothetical protein
MFEYCRVWYCKWQSSFSKVSKFPYILLEFYIFWKIWWELAILQEI